MNSNFVIVVLLGMVTTLINEISLSLGLTTKWISDPEPFTEIADEGFFDGLLSFGRWAVNNVGSFVQLITFTADIPLIINALILSPIGLGVFYLVYVMIRGGAN